MFYKWGSEKKWGVKFNGGTPPRRFFILRVYLNCLLFLYINDQILTLMLIKTGLCFALLCFLLN